jgi:hypothetical protein
MMVFCFAEAAAALMAAVEAELAVAVIVLLAIGAADTAGADAAAANGAADLGEPRRTFCASALFGRPVGAASLSAVVSTIDVLMER